MQERTGQFTFGGKPFTMVGPELRVGDRAPEFELTDNDMKPFRLSSQAGKTVILSVVSSLDTSTCDIETRRFNQEAERLGDDVVILTISMDLPFAQKRWCGTAGINRVKTLSDYKEATFGKNYGVLIRELYLLARTVFVVDSKGVIRYIQRVNEGSHEPDYKAVLNALAELAK